MYAGRLVECGPGPADLQRARPSLHAGAARVDPAHGRQPRAAHRDRGPAARPGRAARAGAPSTRAARRPSTRCREEAPPETASARAHRALLARRRRAGARGVDDRLGPCSRPQASPSTSRCGAASSPGGAGWCARWTACPSRSRPGKTLGRGRRVRLRQDHHRQAGAAARGADRRRHPLRRAGPQRPRRRRGVGSTGKAVQAVFQDPFASLNPRMRVGAIIAEPLVTNERLDAARGRASGSRGCSTWSGLPERARPSSSRTSSRAASASASPSRGRSRCRPELVVLDEPVSALDVSIRAQILNLLRDLQAAARALLPLHRPRPRRGGAHEPHHRGDVPGPDRGDRRRGDRGARDPQASLHPGALRGGAAVASRRAARGDRADRRGAEPAQPAGRLPLPSALPPRDAPLLPGGTGASDRSRTRRACHLYDAAR